MKDNIFENIMKIYKQSWEEQNSDLILSIFTKDGTYQVTPHEEALKGYIEIKRYWEKYPVNDQENIKFNLLNFNFIEGIYYAEWESTFFQKGTNKNVCLKGIFLIKLDGDKIISLKEYWHSFKK